MRIRSLTNEQTKSELDKVSSTFCGAKWGQVLFQLHLGKLNNCCLTPAQEIDQSSLFNSQQLIAEREDFLAGKKIKSCDVCWKTEDKGLLSDRISKSSDPSVISLYQSESRFKATGIIPSYIELSLSNRCQFKCVYCSPENSSSLYAEAKTFGPYRTTKDFGEESYLFRGDNFFLDDDENPYIDAFIKWFPQIVKDIKVLRFTGGEPLLSRRLYDLLGLLIQYPSPELELVFNSNLGVQPKVIDQFLDFMADFPEGSFGKLSFVTSLDGWGSGAELARWGLSLDLFERNFLRIREVFPEAEIRFTCTVNILAVEEIKPLLEKIKGWKQSQSDSDQILITAYPLIYPAFLSPGWCPDLFADDFKQALAYIDEHFVGDAETNGFKTIEKDMLEKAFVVNHSTDYFTQLFDFTLYMQQSQFRKNWSTDRLTPKLRKLLDEGIAYIQKGIENDAFDSTTALKACMWIKCDHEKIKKLLEADLQAGKLNPWALYQIISTRLDVFGDDWIFWWVKSGYFEVADTLLSALPIERLQNFYPQMVRCLLLEDDIFWGGFSQCTRFIQGLPKPVLVKLVTFRPETLTHNQLAFWLTVGRFHPEYGT